jgi:acyl carrier protein
VEATPAPEPTRRSAVSEAKETVLGAVKGLLKRRKAESLEVDLDADLYDDLALDSLEVAELSAVLEDDLGSDPYSEGATPRTIGEIVEFYDK